MGAYSMVDFNNLSLMKRWEPDYTPPGVRDSERDELLSATVPVHVLGFKSRRK